jgi:hypothetical protein
MNQPKGERLLHRANNLMVLVTIADVIVVILELSHGQFITAMQFLAIIVFAWWRYA